MAHSDSHSHCANCSPQPVLPRVVNHIGISVPDIDAAIKFYSESFGIKCLRESNTYSAAKSPSIPIFKIYGAALKEVRVAYMTSGNGVGIELFQFIDPVHEPKQPYKHPEGDLPFDYPRSGFFHVALTVPSVEQAVERVKELGGKIVGEVVELGKNKAAYIQDPWGNVFEMIDNSFECLFANT
ncbi:Glyoxalase/Bleomycin resistance protein/Dihydroxybiphenyl dioxygenase [Microthyrium microscopicum]|uniref:Glyoxalase/Bleomycin resistance protein/Dihydroxybiphenyl dioxygenase n=1 Tax=Microthyrium microscopicum TaxID=703497 RepID=A0A6A6U9I1_9PEZI|nr:Glyoxalase/Bleomycin resistance protein/Dihydroxybiphenyl dioxygenase [Microthyrium microscopicum]